MPEVDAALRDTCAAVGGNVLLAHDPGGKTAAAFNARWRPRAYAVNEAGRVAYVQPDTVADMQAPAAVKQLWQKAR